MTIRPPLLSVLFAVFAIHVAGADEPAFALHDGDRVVFYGDSITQAGGYGDLVEEYTRCHFPKWDVRFYNAGVGGDTVDGGWAGKSDLRVDRDVISLKPTVVTIMLGMNDGHYRALTKETLDAFAKGYRTIVDKIRAALPGVRVYLIRTSPFDDITRAPGFDDGYDKVLQKMGDAVSAIGADEHLEVIDFGTAVNSGLKAVMATDKDLAKQLLPDRVHPNPAGHMVMGSCLLHAWHAPGLVARVEIDASAGKTVSALGATVSALSLADGTLTWRQTDVGLPLPLHFDDANVDLAQKAGANLESLDSEPLVVSGLKAGSYDVKVDDTDVGVFDAGQLASGINLALYNTPMRNQASQEGWAPEDGGQIQKTRRQMFSAAAKGETRDLVAADILAAHDESSQAVRSSLAIPKEHTFTVSPKAP